ncbi:thioredoxin fold domain-containing protein [Candidatus Fermentibacteria bacterium]|nr:thioredoxin fold domain-containing protein [Candidatus Fermentibacteria bacterium]
MPMEHITAENFNEKVIQNATPVLLDFGAAWCGPCKTLEPQVEMITKEYDGSLLVGHVDVGEQPDLAARYGVLGVPTLLFMHKGRVVQQLSGVPSRAKIISAIDSLIDEASDE